MHTACLDVATAQGAAFPPAADIGGDVASLPDRTSLDRLMERYADGDPEAFEELYSLLRPILIGALRRWLRDPVAADDAFQTTMLKLHASRDRFRRGASALPWCFTIAHNVAMDLHRARAARAERPEVELPERAAEPPAPEWDADEERAIIDAVREAVEALPPSFREVVRLHKLEGHEIKAVAEMLGIKPGAARVRAHRGYKELARRLAWFRSR